MRTLITILFLCSIASAQTPTQIHIRPTPGTITYRTPQGGGLDLSAYPALTVNAGPAGVTAPGAAFTLNAAATPAANTPSFNEYNRSDNTSNVSKAGYIMFAAENLNGNATTFKVYDGNTLADATVGNISGRIGSIRLPASNFKPRVIWPSNGLLGKPIIINTAILKWATTTNVAGQTAAVYGLNLANNNQDGTNNSNVYIVKDDGTSGQWCTITDVTRYRVKYVIPAGLANGTYYVYAHNGNAKEYGWSNKLSISVVSASSHVKYRTWGSSTNVAAASGTASTNVTNINSAVSTVGSTGGVVQFASGVYTVDSAPNVNATSKWKGTKDGAGYPTSTIRVSQTFSNPNEGLLNRSGNLSMVMFEDLIFETNGFTTDLTSGGSTDPVFMNLSGSSMLYFKNCVIDARYTEALRINGVNNIYIENCTIIGGPWSFGNTMYIDGGYQIFIAGTTLKMTKDCSAAITNRHVREADVSGNIIKDFDNTTTDGSGWGKGRIWSHLGGGGAAYNCYFSFNQGQGLGVRTSGTNVPDPNSGEMFLWEANASEQLQSPTSATSTTVTFSTATDNTIGADPSAKEFFVHIISGKGQGQSRRILSGGGTTTVTVDAWNTIPDATSVMTIGPFVDNIIVYKNTLDANGKDYIAQNANNVTNASAGCNFYGGVTNSIFDGNTVTKARTGYNDYPTQHSNSMVDANMFNQALNNTIDQTRFALRFAMEHSSTTATSYNMLYAAKADGNTVTNTITQTLSGVNFTPDIRFDIALNVTYGVAAINGIIFSNNTIKTTINNWAGTSNGQNPSYPQPSEVPSGAVVSQVNYNNL